MEQLEYWQAIEDGAEIEEEPKKKKKTRKNQKHEELTADDLPQETQEEVATLKQK